MLPPQQVMAEDKTTQNRLVEDIDGPKLAQEVQSAHFLLVDGVTV